MLAEGFEHAADLYTWRCCSRAVPMVKYLVIAMLDFYICILRSLGC